VKQKDISLKRLSDLKKERKGLEQRVGELKKRCREAERKVSSIQYKMSMANKSITELQGNIQFIDISSLLKFKVMSLMFIELFCTIFSLDKIFKDEQKPN
jgi:predicted RNase H-like nuclease (RuvC/YqgF family)